MLFCAPIVGLWYWCTDQYIVQRTLIAPNQTEARRGSIFAAFLKLLPVFIFIIPGMIAVALAKSGKVPGLAPLVDATGETINAAAQAAFPLLVQQVLPVGMRGDRRGWTARGPDELVGRGVQRVLDAVHHGFLPEVPTPREPDAAGLGRARGDRR